MHGVIPVAAGYGPTTVFAEQLDAEKYRGEGETFREATTRVASRLADDDKHFRELREVTMDQRFLFGGRIRAAIGSIKATTAYNCFVSGRIPDSFTERDNPEGSSIMDRATEAARTMRMGGGIGYGFSQLRPRGALIKKLMSNSSGPLAFMKIFNSVCEATSSAGNRRGAQMGVLRIDHPDIMEFVHAKHEKGVLEGFNISVAVTDEFMECLDADRPFPLRFGGQVYREVDPMALWDAIMRSTWDWAEPGVLFVDTINRMNNLWYCEEIEATNPCGEQPLPQFGACLLGSFNLVKYLTRQGAGKYSFDYDYLASDIPTVVRAMDNVIDSTRYPLPEQEQEAKNKRRMGVGGMGAANAIEACGHPYGSSGFLDMEDRILHLVNREAYIAGTKLAAEKGAFPLYDRDRYLRGQFVRTLDTEVQERIEQSGLRNSHYTSIAPTGTIAQTADNVSASWEPVTSWGQKRTVLMAGGREVVDQWDYGFGQLRVRGRRSLHGEVSPDEHVKVLVRAQKHVDSAVSKTVNTDGSVPWEDFKRLYLKAYVGGAKGCTTYNKDGKRAGIFSVGDEPTDLPFPGVTPQATLMELSVAEGDSCSFDPATGRRSCE